ncbi:O-antigen polymerase [Micromonospora deserti]|uniref:Oligosaccharide repeat unit polymerase n=1 Tax=Micromonospora deserti TaxID=2070366 RepID=A0A2W2CU95_9ACTN|nr:O-antigen polymerase [Micromonospora deserti]PZG01431.1 hypothetical protein C1I99_07200 [Micromonospora deserti]
MLTSELSRAPARPILAPPVAEPGREHRRPPERRRVTHWAVLFVLLAAYVALLQVVYRDKVSPVFEYLNLLYRSPDRLNYTVALVLVAVTALAMPRRIRRPSDLILWAMFVMVATPSIVVPQYADILPATKALELAVVVAVVFLLVIWGARVGPSWALRVARLPTSDLWTFLLVVSLLTYGYMAITTGLSFRMVGLGDVWEIRSVYRDQIAVHGPLLAYLVRLQGNVVNPLLIVRGIYTRRWWMVLLGCLGQIPIYAATGFKLTLLSIPAIIALTLLFRWRTRPRGSTILLGVVALIVAVLAVDHLLNGMLYTQVFVNRLLLSPGILTAAHVMVFTDLPKAHWGYSFLSPFVTYPYAETPEFMVGAQMFGQPQTSANASLFGDGYSNFGYPGVLIEAAVLVLLLWLVDAAARHLPLGVSSAILLVPTVALANTSVFTSILSNGFAYAILLMACLPAVGWSREGRGRSGGSPPDGPTRRGRHRRDGTAFGGGHRPMSGGSTSLAIPLSDPPWRYQ